MEHTVHLTSAHYPFDPRIFHKQLSTLAKNGYKTTLICNHNNSLVRNGVQVDAVGDADSRIERWKSLPKIAKAAKKKKADIYHFHDPELLPVGWYLSKNTNSKIIYDVHEDYTAAIQAREWIPKLIKPMLARLFPQIESKVIDSVDHVITADNQTLEKIAERVRTPVTSLRNFPRTESITIKDLDINRHHENILAYVGGLDRERGLMNMLKLTSDLQERGTDVCLWLIGEFPNDEVENEARSLIRSTGISGSVRLFGYVDYEEIFSYLSLADLGLLLADESRFKRNIPTKFFEYLYAGLPVVLTEIESLTEYMDDSYCVPISSQDFDTAPQSVQEILSDRKNISKMGESGRKKVLSEFSWESESRKLLDTYRKLTA